ncbi:MAG TPA: sensor histidine kinase, partial [Brevundimonas sp.]
MSPTEAPIPPHVQPPASPHLLALAGGELAGLPELPRRGRGLSLRTLIVLRWLAVIGQTSAILTAYF